MCVLKLENWATKTEKHNQISLFAFGIDIESTEDKNYSRRLSFFIFYVVEHATFTNPPYRLPN